MSAAKAGAASAMRAAALRKIFFMGVPLGTQRAHCLGFCTQNVCCRGATGQVNRLIQQRDETWAKVLKNGEMPGQAGFLPSCVEAPAFSFGAAEGGVSPPMRPLARSGSGAAAS